MATFILSAAVVYRPFPTSNHNTNIDECQANKLYIVRFLHQTTTQKVSGIIGGRLYIVRFLHQTTTLELEGQHLKSCISSVSYIKPQHKNKFVYLHTSCISSVSYIKPQLLRCASGDTDVVYRPFPTLNHNRHECSFLMMIVVYRPFPTSNHNWVTRWHCTCRVVYRPFPTSNHNMTHIASLRHLVVYRPFPTSNHNSQMTIIRLKNVVYRPFPTSNHNYNGFGSETLQLYIVRFLHQTTT